ncbi:MAG: phosphate/phosphite/phosphonate ABC transporter substrate-binding protein, partial [Bacteriovoracales bacterium]
GCTGPSELGTKENPVKIFFSPSSNIGVISESSKDLVKFLEKETGIFFEIKVPTSYISVVEAFGSKRADIGIISSFGYLLAHQKYGVKAGLRIVRYGKDFYRGQIVARADSGIKTLKDLNGKSFAFTDPSSISGYIFPLKMLMENNIVLKNKIFAARHDNVINMVYQKQVEAGATFNSDPSPDGAITDARSLVISQFPDVTNKIKILALTENIPNDPVVFRSDLSDLIRNSFSNALKKYLNTPEGNKTFSKIYNFQGVVPATDSDYDGLRQIISKINLDLKGLVQ